MAQANPFDQFDEAQANPFDQFDTLVEKTLSPDAHKLAAVMGGDTIVNRARAGGYPTGTLPDPLTGAIYGAGSAGEQLMSLVMDAGKWAVNTDTGKRLLQPVKEFAEPVVQSLTDLAKSIVGTDVGKAQLATGQDVKTLADRFPQTTETLGKMAAATNLIPAAGAVRKLGPALLEGELIGSDLLGLATRKTAAQLEVKAGEVIEKGIDKGIRPTVVGKRNAGQIAKYYDNAKTAVKTIISEFPDQMPKTLDEFSTVIKDTKKKIYEKYNAISTAAGEAGVMTDLNGTRGELAGIIEAPNTPRSVKVAASKALREISGYDAAITPAMAEDLVAHINTLTKPFWNNPNPSDATYTTMLERVSSNVRKATSDAI